MAETSTASPIVDELTSSLKFKNFIKQLLQETVSEQISNLNKEVQSLRQELNNIKDEVEKLQGENHDLQVAKEKLEQISKDNNMAQRSTIHNKARRTEIRELMQYSRRNCVLVTGIPESQGENTDDIIMKLAADKLEVPMDEIELDRTHRIGKPNHEKPRPIVVKFTRHNKRQQIMRNRKKLKGTKIGIQELLTKYNQDLLKRARDLVDQCHHVKSAWTWDGRVTVLAQYEGQSPRKITINKQQDLKDIFAKRQLQPNVLDESYALRQAEEVVSRAVYS